MSSPAITAGSALARFGRGFGFPFRAFRYLSHRRALWGWVAVPALINFAMFTGGVISSFVLAPRLLAVFWSRPEAGFLVALWVVSAWVLRVAMASVVGMLVYLLAGVLAAPFNEVLSERVEQQELGDAAEPWGWKVFFRDTLFSVLHSLGSLSLFIGIMAPLWLVNLFPGVGTVIFTIASWTVTSFFLAREMLDGVTSRRRLSFVSKFRLVGQHKALMGGFGFASNLLLWVPLLNFVCLPVGVVGATLLYCELERAGLAPSRKALPVA